MLTHIIWCLEVAHDGSPWRYTAIQSPQSLERALGYDFREVMPCNIFLPPIRTLGNVGTSVDDKSIVDSKRTFRRQHQKPPPSTTLKARKLCHSLLNMVANSRDKTCTSSNLSLPFTNAPCERVRRRRRLTLLAQDARLNGDIFLRIIELDDENDPDFSWNVIQAFFKQADSVLVALTTRCVRSRSLSQMIHGMVVWC